MIDLWLCVVAVVVGCLLTVSVVFFCKRRWNHQTKPKFGWIDIVSLFNENKMFPVECSLDWIFADYLHSLRVYRRRAVIQSTTVSNLQTLFACTAKIKASPTMVLSILKDFRRQVDWNLTARDVLKQLQNSVGGGGTVSIVTAGSDVTSSRLSASASGSSEPPVKHDVIWLNDVTAASDDSAVVRCLKRLRIMLRCNSLKPLHRYWNREENGCCWLLEHSVELNSWTLYLMQPTDGWFENDKCVVTFVACPSRRSDSYSQLALRLACLRDYLLLKRVQRTTVGRLTTTAIADPADPSPTATNPASRPSIQQQQRPSASTSPTSSGPSPPTGGSESKDQLTLLQKFRKIIDEKKELYEIEKKKKSQRHAAGDGSAELTAGDKAEIVFGLLKPNPSGLGASTSGAGPAASGSSSGRVPKEGRPGVDYERVKEERRLAARGRSGSRQRPSAAAAVGDEVMTMKRVESASASSRCAPTQNVDESNAVRRRSRPDSIHRHARSTDAVGNGQNDQLPVRCEQETTTTANQRAKLRRKSSDDEVERAAAELRAQTDATAVYLLAEKANVANLNIADCPAEQARQTGGWIYCGLEKDVVILRKAINERNSVQCYFGKGIIHCAPEVVFETLRYPTNRQFYDEMLKSVDVLFEFENGMKVVHMYHEASQLFKKEGRDYCILQHEKLDGMKYIITMQSIQWLDCPDFDTVIRAKFLPSGWIIEPVMKENKLHSMVTYITQMELSRNRSNTSGLVDEMAARQPLCIYNLRQFIATQHEDALAAESVATETDSVLSAHSKPGSDVITGSQQGSTGEL